MEKNFRPTWIDVNLKALKRNILKIHRLVAPSRLMFVVKADAYGHGAGEISSFVRNMVWGFGVSSIEEGLILRKRVRNPILVLGSLYPFESFLEAIKKDLSVTISSFDAARQAVEASKKVGRKIKCHIKIETGMGRIGARKPAAGRIFRYLVSFPRHAVLEGAYSHLSSSETDRKYTLQQFSYYRSALREFGNLPAHFVKHLCNSHAAIHYPRMRLDMVRCGLACYGLMRGFTPVMSFKTRIVFLKNVRKGSFLSYEKSFKCARPMKIATLPVGYADGYSRRLSNKSFVLVRGQKCRVLGNITMDMMMIDVTNIRNPGIGEEVVLVGKSGNAEIKISNLAEKSGTIAYEAASIISKRVPRIYTR